MERLTKSDELEDARRQIADLLNKRGEWFCTVNLEKERSRQVALREGEWEVSVSHGALILSVWSEKGFQVWRVAGWSWTDEKLLIEATRRMGAERALIELIPRASVSAAVETVADARRAAAASMAHLAAQMIEREAKIERVGLSAGKRPGELGRYARILIRAGRERIAVAGPIADMRPYETDTFLSSTLLWLMRLSEKTREKLALKLWLIVPHSVAQSVAERLALLREELRRDIVVFETDDERESLTCMDVPILDDLLISTQPARFFHSSQSATSEMASRIVDLAPDAIDVVRAKRGETLRFHGLPFARVRRVVNDEHVWFGIQGARQLLDESNWPQLLKLIEDLAEHRRAETSDTRHALYKASPEAWLESLLRRDIRQLDAGLIVSPLHAQFRTSRDDRAAVGVRPVDILALRRDGRLVVIELKVAEDASLVLQAADYWRRVETYRRQGTLFGARLFGAARIEDVPPLVYLVAPMLRFHRAFESLARTVNREIEMYRFDINEDWRGGVRVMRRMRVGD